MAKGDAWQNKTSECIIFYYCKQYDEFLEVLPRIVDNCCEILTVLVHVLRACAHDI